TIASSTRTGTGQYAANLCAALMRTKHEHELVIYCDGELLDWFEERRNGQAVTLRPRAFSSPARRIFWEQTKLAAELQSERVDVLHAMAFSSPFLNSIPTVVTVHDLVFRRFPETVPLAKKLYYRLAFGRAIQKAVQVIAVSEQVRSELLTEFHLPVKKVQAIPEAAAPEFGVRPQRRLIDRIRKKLGLTQPYILSVSTLEPRKNLLRLLEAFNLFKQASGLPHKLVLTGKPGWLKTADRIVRQSTEEVSDLVCTGYVDQADMPALYAGAELFLFPSLYEGFGLPPLEALACGTPVIASDIPVLREVCGQAALFVDPREPSLWRDAILKLLHDDGLRQRLQVRGRQRAREFSWEKTAQKTLEVYERCAHG
ncbi:MAG: glycosyltransferase family 4 protein, partial [bacterium]